MTRTSVSRVRVVSENWTSSRGSSSLRVVDVKAIVVPSGDQIGLVAPRGICVIARGSPPASGMTKICGPSGRPSRSTCTNEGEVCPVGRPPRREVARPDGELPRRVASVDVHRPDRGVVLVALAIDGHAHEGDFRTVGRDLRVGDPDEGEEILIAIGRRSEAESAAPSMRIAARQHRRTVNEGMSMTRPFTAEAGARPGWAG